MIFCGKCVVFQKWACPCKLHEPAKGYSRNNRISGRSAVMELLELKSSGASKQNPLLCWPDHGSWCTMSSVGFVQQSGLSSGNTRTWCGTQGNLWLHCTVRLERSFPENSVYGRKSEILAAGYVLNNKKKLQADVRKSGICLKSGKGERKKLCLLE